MLNKHINWKYEIGQRIIDYNEDGFVKRDLTIIDRKIIQVEKYSKDRKKAYIRNIKWYTYNCNICGFNGKKHWDSQKKMYNNEYWISESNLIGGSKCSLCASQIVVEGINDIPTTAPWMIKYFQGGYNESKKYTCCSNKNIYPICPDCKQTLEKSTKIGSIYRHHSIGCLCGDGFSYGHKYIFNLLTQLKLDFIDNHTFEWCKFYNPYKNKKTTGEYDFVLENIKTIIEVDGDWHRQDNKMSGQTKEESIFLDNEKDRLANEHGYKIIRISDEGDIKQNILNSDLNKLFDLNKINWLKIEEFALSNRVKEACDYKKNNPNLTTTEIGKSMNISPDSIRIYLIKGNSLGWCNYDTQEESIKKYKKQSKELIVFKNGIPIHIEESINKLERESYNILGKKLDSTGIRRTCRGVYSNHKGYTFKYVQDLTLEELTKYKQQLEQTQFNQAI